jgi:tRNA U34 5-methylaminomethyl-2-thiouridine-forming methyltransferase MnmC
MISFEIRERYQIMHREIVHTNDGSHTISIPAMHVSYHSKYGAIRESEHVFIQAGLEHCINQHPLPLIYIFEMGFGTGLNALLTLQKAIKQQQPIHYTAVELFPLLKEEVELLNYGHQLQQQPSFLQLHDCNWEEDVMIDNYFTLHKTFQSLINFSTHQQFNIIYYDAFAPTAQPELWTQDIFSKLYSMLVPKGVLVTYCSKGDVRRAMQSAGFIVEKLQGPPGKREMLRAIK